MSDDYSGKHPDGRAPDSESDELTEDKKEWLRRLPSKDKLYETPAELPAWSKIAIAKKMLGQYDTWKEAAEDHGKAAGTLYTYKKTPGGEEYIKRFEGYLDDPAKLAEMLLRGELHGFTIDFMSMWQTAVDSNDYAEVRKMWESINDRVPGGLSKRGSDSGGGATINVTFSGVPLEVESEFEEIEADYEVVDGDD